MGVRACVYLNIDMGMGCLGVLSERALELMCRIWGASYLELAGVMMYIMVMGGALDEETSTQVCCFEEVLNQVCE